MSELRRAAPLNGLALAGGDSTRMGTAKAALPWESQALLSRTLALFASLGARVFVSCRADQSDRPSRRGHSQIHDADGDLGPLGGIRSAFRGGPHAAWRGVACAVRFLDASTASGVFRRRNHAREATAHVPGADGMPQPRCAIHEPALLSRLDADISNERFSPGTARNQPTSKASRRRLPPSSRASTIPATRPVFRA